MSERVKELERLDETRLLAIMGMYAEKRRRKHWHDQNIKKQKFQVGDLVLLYTLKKHKRKLKKRGLGPYVISELNNSGAVRLETLDGEPMANFINGSRLKKFEEPLTETMLQQLLLAKSRKEGLEKLKKQAREEALERKRKMKERQKAQVLTVTTSAKSSTQVTPFKVAMQLLTGTKMVQVESLIDTGADCNVLSYETWEKLGKPDVSPSSLTFTSFAGVTSNCLGTIYLKARIQHQSMGIIFHIAHRNQAVVNVILGRHWIQQTNF